VLKTLENGVCNNYGQVPDRNKLESVLLIREIKINELLQSQKNVKISGKITYFEKILFVCEV
jgi:hypothetical protein